VGGYVVGGDLKVNSGIGASLSSRYSWPSGVGLGLTALGSLHSSDVLDDVIGMAQAAAELRVTRPSGGEPYLGGRASIGFWKTQVPNPITLQYTTVSAAGEGIGVLAGLTWPASPAWDMGLEASYTWMSFGDAGTEAHAFAGTDTKARVFSFSLAIYRKHAEARLGRSGKRDPL